MTGRAPAAWTRLASAVRERPGDALVAALALALVAYVVGYPLSVATYPPMIDLPFHASAMSVLRHYFDPAFHFREQFELHPIDSPYLTFYVLGALLAIVFPIALAAKLAAAAMLALLPLGLAVLFHGMKKTPLWGVLGAGVVWTHLTHWGFLNFMGALGLFAAAVGLALMVVDRPTRARKLALGLTLAAVFFTHVFRFPFAVLSVVAAAAAAYPATRRFRPILAPLAPNLALFVAWWLVRSRAFQTSVGPLGLDLSRLAEIPTYFAGTFSGLTGQREHRLFVQMGVTLAVVAIVAAAAFVGAGRARGRSSEERMWGAAVTLLPLGLACGFLLGYLVLPKQIGQWWYVYPREITPAIYIALAAVPDMPKNLWARLGIVALVGGAVVRTGQLVAEEYADFETTTTDFRAILPQVSRSPKLLYLIELHAGTARARSPFVHLPAWIQAEHGGWLSFQFVGWEYSPIRYREGSPDVPPKVPDHWEWEPKLFDVHQQGPWFDEFLVRARRSPGARFEGDPEIRQVAHEGTWWLYRRAGR